MSVRCFLTKAPKYNPFSIRAMSTCASKYQFETLAVSNPSPGVLHVQLNRPDKRNAMNIAFWAECRDFFTRVAEDGECRAIVLSGSGKHFTSGLDLSDAGPVLMQLEGSDAARRAFKLRKLIGDFQESFSSIERCPQPVIAAIHSACIGGGIDMICAADIRYCTADAAFCVKEVDIGLAADVGTLQRFPRVVGNDSWVRELCYTARMFYADEALRFGLVSRVFPDRESLYQTALATASSIADKSPVAITGTKRNLVYSRDHPIDQSLEYMVTWNSAMLQTDDIPSAVTASMGKSKPSFSKL